MSLNTSILKCAVSINVTGIIYSFIQCFRVIWQLGVHIYINRAWYRFKCMKQQLRMKRQPKKRKLWMQCKEWKWNQVPWLSVCAPTVHVKGREAGMGREVEVEVEEKKKKNLHLWNETAHWDADGKQYKQRQLRKDDAVNDIKLQEWI